MLKNAVMALLACTFVLFCAVANAAQTFPGTWTISPSYDSNHVSLELRSEGSEGSYHDDSSNVVTLGDLGLSRALLDSSGARTAFGLRRDAGTFAFDGWVQQGEGSGHFTFTPNPRYEDELRTRGYTIDEPRKLMTAGLLDLSIAYIDEIRGMGFNDLTFDNLVAFRALRIDAPYINSMRQHFGDLDTNTVISLRALNVTSDYINGMKSEGLAPATAHDAIELRALHVDSAYIKEMASVGYDHLSAHDLVQLRALRVDAAFVRSLEAHGFHHLTIEQLIQAKAMRII